MWRFSELILALSVSDFVKSYVAFYGAQLKFEIAKKFGIFEAINHIMLRHGSEADFENGDEEGGSRIAATY